MSAPSLQTPLIPDSLRVTIESRLAKGEIDLPVLPEVAQKVVVATRDQDVDLRKIAKLIARDASMAAHVLRLANSALLNAGVPIVSLQQALNRLGLSRVRQVALMIACETSVFSIPGRMDEARRMFRTSLGAALVAAEIAKRRRRNVEEGYLAGLFHGVGQPVLLQLLMRLERDAATTWPDEVIEKVQETYHSSVGCQLLKSWGLAATLQDAVLNQRQPTAAPATIGDLAWTTHLAALIAAATLAGVPLTEQELSSNPATLALGFYPEETAALVSYAANLESLIQEIA